MPIYTYKCRKCGNVFEKFKSMSANGTECCELCSSEALRVFSPAGIIFKGSGFYTTDYKSGSNKAGISTEASKSGDRDIKKDDNRPQGQPASSSESGSTAGTGPASGTGSGSVSGSGSKTKAGSGTSPD